MIKKKKHALSKWNYKFGSLRKFIADNSKHIPLKIK